MKGEFMDVERSDFIIEETAEYENFVLLSLKYQRRVEMSLGFIGIDKPNKGDILSLPDSMLREEDGSPLFSNYMLSFGKPDKKIAIPKGFNIEQDYAYIYYRADKKRILVQRYYG